MADHKILFLKKLSADIRATSVVVGESGFHWRVFTEQAGWTAALGQDNFSLIVVDHRGTPGDPLAFISSLPGIKAGTPTFLISEEHLELPRVIQAIRLGVKDLFHVPLDLKLLVERVRTVLGRGPVTGGLEQWSDFVVFLADGEAPTPTALKPVAGKGGTKPADTAARLALVSLERDQLAAERTSLRESVRDTGERLAELEVENCRLTTEQKRFSEARAAHEIAKHELLAAQEKLETEQLLQAQARTKPDGGSATPLEASKSRQQAEAAERIEIAHAALIQRQKQFEQQVAAEQALAEKTAAGLIGREQDLVEREKAQAQAAQRLVAEQEELETAQLLAEQAQTRMDEAVAELQQAAEKLKAQRAQIGAEQRQGAEELARREAQVSQAEQTLAEKSARLEQVDKNQSAQWQKAQAQLAEEKSAHEKEAQSQAARVQQLRVQMQQLLTSS